MDLYDFYNTFIEAVAGDGDLSTWAQVNFGTEITVFADLTSADLPTADDMPYVIFHTPEVSKHQERRINEYVLGVDMALTKDELKTRLEGNLDEPAGIELVCDFTTKIVAAAVAALPANTSLGYRLTADTLGMLPEVHGYMDIEFSEQITIGTDPLA